MSLCTPEHEASQSQAVRNAIQVTAGRGAATPPGSGKVIADYLLAHCEEFSPSEVRGYLKNLNLAMRELREELRAIES
jgi:hypothetical protein